MLKTTTIFRKWIGKKCKEKKTHTFKELTSRNSAIFFFAFCIHSLLFTCNVNVNSTIQSIINNVKKFSFRCLFCFFFFLFQFYLSLFISCYKVWLIFSLFFYIIHSLFLHPPRLFPYLMTYTIIFQCFFFVFAGIVVVMKDTSIFF